MQKFSIRQSYHFFINLPKNSKKSTHHKPKGRFFRSLCFSREIICEFANQRDGSFGLFAFSCGYLWICVMAISCDREWSSDCKPNRPFGFNYPIPQFYHFDSPKVRERILYANFLQVNQDVKDMIKEIPEFNKK